MGCGGDAGRALNPQKHQGMKQNSDRMNHRKNHKLQSV